MCIYWRKLHTCGDISDRPYLEMCHSGVLSNTVCAGITEDPTPRKSHFPCYSCIKNEARREVEEGEKERRERESEAVEAHQRALKEKRDHEQRLKEERVRREAREKAAREREEESRIKQFKEEQERKAKKDGGLWIETKKGKGKKSGGNNVGGNPLSPVGKIVGRENRAMGGAGVGAGAADKSPKKGVDPGGRAGTWGPKKILSRKENGGGAQAFSSGAIGGGGGGGGGGGNGSTAGNGGVKK
ncbi:hypothetical protein NX059_000949 [Plenodomus lindquistii]|nr:hypothetical protein NX059_000949 [Plenodomus lindquistii]